MQTSSYLSLRKRKVMSKRVVKSLSTAMMHSADLFDVDAKGEMGGER
jgi:hypothetical protein